MADDSKEAKRARAETRFKKAATTDRESKELIESERSSMRKKTERLRALRLAKDAAEGVSEIDKTEKKPTPTKKSRPPMARQTLVPRWGKS